MSETCNFLVDRKDLACWRWHLGQPGEKDDLDPDEISVCHQRFAFTANNITYAHAGEARGFWDFFPASPPWGSIPAWGIGRVERSRCAEIAEGERIYGFFPMSNRLVLRPERIKPHGFVDGRPHRVHLTRTYNEYVRIDRDRNYDEGEADLHLVLRPLFSLSFFLAHFLADNGFFGARTVIVSSASSKAAMGLAFVLRRIGTGDLKIVGLTSPSRIEFLAACGYYDRVVDYAAAGAALEDCGPSAYVDISGDDGVLEIVHTTLRDDLRGSFRAGMARTRPARDDHGVDGLPGPKPEFFFTPHHILARRESWGVDELRRRLSGEWKTFTGDIRSRVAFEHHHGRNAIQSVYGQVLAGLRPPDRADILAFDET
jgi:hypothetical protein